MVVPYSTIRLFDCLEGQLVRPIADIATEIVLVAAQLAAHLRIGDSFAEPSAMVELGLADLKRWMCSAAWFVVVVAALDSERCATAGRNWDLVGRFLRAA